jgi:HD-GYP domain-containing protein (c-di-GMP phosphodiesterase class II)
VQNARPISRPLAIYAWSLASLGAVALVFSWIYSPPVVSLVSVVLTMSALVAESLAIELPSAGSTSLAYPLTIAVAILFGPAAAGTAAALGAFSWNDIRRRRAPSATALNFGQLSLSACAAGWVFLALGGQTLVVQSGGSWYYDPLTLSDFPAVLLPLGAMAVVSVAMNYLLVGYGLHLYLEVDLAEVFARDVVWLASRQLVLAAVGITIAQVLSLNRLAFVLFVVPLLVSRQVFQHYWQLRAAYLDTVKSLVGAVEAKDPYTRGHSERVARYAMCLARDLRRSQSRLDAVQYAGLLHDVGKIAIPMRVLNKPSKLTDEEYGQIKDHPRLGAEVISRVPYLNDIVEPVLYHHEHLDGSGYCSGVKGDEIPYLARILSIADAYDAMTSQRPYRRALTMVEASTELARCAGSQFDNELVSRFLRLLEDGEPDLVPESAATGGEENGTP